MRTLKLLCVTLASCVLFLGCGSKPAAPLQETVWQPEKVLQQKVPAASRAQMTLKTDLSVNGSGGINRFVGQYTLSEPDGLIFSPLAATKMAGLSAEASAVEDNFLQALAQAKKYKINGNKLTLLNEANKTVALLKAAVN